MRFWKLISTIAAGAALTLSVGTAHAAVFYYETCAQKHQALGTIASGGTSLTTPTGGGLCVTGESGFAPLNGALYALGPSSVGVSGNNLISFTTGTLPIANYRFNFTFSPLNRANGAIWDVTLINGGVSGTSATSLGTTNAVAAGTPGGGSVTTVVNGFTGGTIWIGITNLVDQYNGQADTLPAWGQLTNPMPANSSGTILNQTNTEFTLTESVSFAPEPASVTLFIGGIGALGALRRRKRQ